VAQAELVVLAELVVQAGLVVLAALVGEIACPRCLLGAVTVGNTIQSIAAGLPIKTGQPQIALAGRLVAILSPGARRAPGNKLAGKVATWLVTAEALE
jgi:hypothetical protein